MSEFNLTSFIYVENNPEIHRKIHSEPPADDEEHIFLNLVTLFGVLPYLKTRYLRRILPVD